MILIPLIPRYKFVNRVSYLFMIRNKISDLPFDPYSFLIAMGYSVKTYSFHARKLGCTSLEIAEACDSLDGYSVYNEKTKKYKIIFNDYINSPERIRWTLAHELGHIILNHFVDFEQTKLLRGGINDKEYEILDKEADAFASKILAPEIILIHAGIENPNLIHTHCGLSNEAAMYKSKTIAKIKQKKILITSIEKQIVSLFKSFINQKTCIICGYHTSHPNAKYCAMCGTKTLTWGKGENTLIYNNIRITQCVVCGNEEIDINARFCKICGTYVLNKCSNSGCNLVADANARFCLKCGNPTDFQQRKYFKNWRQEKHENQNRTTETFPDEEIPF